MSVAGTDGPKKKKSGLLSGSRSIWILAVVFALFAMGGALAILSKAADQVSYWVLGQAVPARTQITPEMLVEIRTSNGGEPRVAYDLGYFLSNPDGAFTKIPLRPGDILTPSNTGKLDRITDGLPKDFVVASISVDPANAVAGKVRRGDYVEIAAISDEQTGKMSKIVLHHVLVLDVTVAPKSIAVAANDGQAGAEVNNPGPESAAVRGGIPSLYTVAVSPKDFTKLALLGESTLSLALSANQTTPTIDAYTTPAEIFGTGSVPDSGKGTEKAVEPDVDSQQQQPASD